MGATRRPSTAAPASTRARLDALAGVVDRCEPPDAGHLLVHVVDHGDDLDLATKALAPGLHPFEALAGFRAPESWWAVGVRATGRARHLDRPDRARRSRITHLVARTGEECSVVHAGGQRLPTPGPAEGTLADLCRRVLALPTPPPPAPPSALWTALWLDRVLSAWNRPDRRRRLLSAWHEIASLHPAWDDEPGAEGDDVVAAGRALAARWSWRDLRHGRRAVPLPEGELPDDIARWMDDGFYARWTLGGLPAIGDLAHDLYGLLGERHGPRLAQAVLGLHR